MGGGVEGRGVGQGDYRVKMGGGERGGVGYKDKGILG
jgi:hypothetical protein